ncbi:MAG TPA: glycerol-3-phosphate acyltransferase [Candidatus Pacearchaeota archaeon]|nr:glycerol-3-phosphate acyltransferase [Candidatus Pacearchaeota archaeon]
MSLLIISIISYFLGSIPLAYLITKAFTGKDIRKVGSGNVGTLNTFRAIKEEKSIKLAIIGFLLSLACDMGKAVLAIFISQQFLGYNLQIGLILAAAFVVIGHNWPIFLKFRGGRGAACLMGVFLYLDPMALIVWGVPILIFSIIAELILEKRVVFKISQLFSAIGSQMVGRFIGIIVGLMLLYFYNVQIFQIAFLPIILLLIQNIDRLKNYLQELKQKNTKG